MNIAEMELYLVCVQLRTSCGRLGVWCRSLCSALWLPAVRQVRLAALLCVIHRPIGRYRPIGLVLESRIPLEECWLISLT